MARKTNHKYPRRPWNDGGHWVNGVWHSRTRQRRGDPLAPENIRRGPETNTHTHNMGVNHTTQWTPLKKDTILYLCMRGELSITQVESGIRREWHSDRADFRADFVAALKEAVMEGEISNGLEIMNKYRSCLVGW